MPGGSVVTRGEYGQDQD